MLFFEAFGTYYMLLIPPSNSTSHHHQHHHHLLLMKNKFGLPICMKSTYVYNMSICVFVHFSQWLIADSGWWFTPGDSSRDLRIPLVGGQQKLLKWSLYLSQKGHNRRIATGELLTWAVNFDIFIPDIFSKVQSNKKNMFSENDRQRKFEHWPIDPLTLLVYAVYWGWNTTQGIIGFYAV